VKANQEIREAAAKANVRLWRIAEKLGVSDDRFSRHMRKEFSAEKKAEVLSIIKALSKGAQS